MLTYEDCIGLCELSEAEIQAISEHEHIPAIVRRGAWRISSPNSEG